MASTPNEPYVGEAIASIYAQSCPPARVIVIVNGPGSTGAPGFVDIGESFPAVEIITSDIAAMLPALILGLEQVTTPYVAFLDADDWWGSEKQERQIALLEADPELDAVYCEAVNFRIRPDGSLEEGTVATTRLFSCTTFRTTAFERFGAPDPEASHFSWLVRWWNAAQASGISAVGSEYRGLWRRVHGNNGWVVERAVGEKLLLEELRRIYSSKQAAK
jgi:glycosyltransferase involved in cell wall biosynthesis